MIEDIPGFTRPTRDDTMMNIAGITSMRGTCNRMRVGAVIERDGRVLVTGYNGPPAGQPHCNHTVDEPCRKAIHAEANAIAYAARWGINIEGATLHCTLSACRACAQLIVASGIARVIALKEYRDIEGLMILEENGVILH